MLKFTCCDPVRQFLKSGQAQVLRGITRGLEREGLRVDAAAQLARSPHPLALGSKLTHPWITTDYAEAMLEFITPPAQERGFALDFLRQIHRFSAPLLQGDMLWAGSMPCVLGADSEIVIADYGQSHEARFKAVYREGLGWRYGRQMQAIAGAHYNWSLPEAFWQILQETCSAAPLSMQAFISERYFGLIRNFLRFGWLIPYLFGASPALHASFLRGKKSNLQILNTHTLYGPHATSLRMGDLGYRNRAQANLRVGFNTLAQYTQDLETALRTPDPFYQTIGVHEGAQRRQLNANLLQIENEFYASIRPKRISRERPAVALQKYGVQYVEVRLFDLHPLEDLGITPMQLDFADVLLLMCLFRESPPITSREQSENDENKNRVVNRGRQPDLHLVVHNREQPLQPLLHELFDDLLPFAEMLDAAYGDTRYRGCLQSLRERIDHPQSTPSAQVLEAVHSHGGFVEFAMHMARQHHQRWLAEPLDAPTLATFTAQAARSLQAHAALEAQSQGSFEEYVARYYAQSASQG